MLTSTNAPRRRKKATNLSIDHDLLDRARRLKLNLSQAVEAGLAEAIRQHERAQWLEKNRAALDAYNEHVEKHGVFSDGLRSF
ncbi:MAG TPA: type II toxin-antitoxin system CcdA family antitoxin [Burkholderiales bacterium]|nr:type II toxin-antitoxin system CcdA family antitoxin [Burkholderiales bacterium]